MKKTMIIKLTTITVVIISILLSGCGSQFGGGQYDFAGVDKNGIYFGRAKTYGSYFGIGKDVPETNRNFNDTVTHGEDCNMVNNRIKSGTTDDPEGFCEIIHSIRY